jgi:hypothetical protein
LGVSSRTCDAMRVPRWKTSIVLAVTRSST